MDPKTKSATTDETYDEIVSQINPTTLRLIMYLIKSSSQDTKKLFNTNAKGRLTPRLPYQDDDDDLFDIIDDGAVEDDDDRPMSLDRQNGAKKSRLSYLLKKIDSKSKQQDRAIDYDS